MTVPGWMYWFTYILVPIAAGLFVWLEPLRLRPMARRPARVARAGKWIGSGMLVSGAVNTFEVVRMMGDMNRFGIALYVGILASQFGLGLLLRGGRRMRASADASVGPIPSSARRAIVERALAVIAVTTAVTMLLVRAQILWIFG